MITEADWFAATEPSEMVFWMMERNPSSRKFNLFGYAISRQFWDFLSNECQNLIEHMERILDEGLSSDRLREEQQWACRIANQEAAVIVYSQEPVEQIRLNSTKGLCYVTIGVPWGAYGYFDNDPDL